VSSRPIYSIGAVGQMLGIAPATLRTWEERYGLPVPERSPGGHRLYSRDQVDQLRFVKVQLAQGMAPADAHRLLAERLAAGWLSFDEPEAGKTRLLVLLAERDPYAADLAEYFLRTEGYEVASALDAIDATQKLEELTPSMTVIDLLISGGNGLELCRQLKQRSDAPILAISTLDTSDAALEAGADAFLQKPLDPLQLVSAVKDLLGASAFLRGTAGGPR
jgi:CheY-like chemotaxis protein